METNNLFGNPEELFDYINQDKDDKFVKHGVNKFIENAFKSSDVWEGVQSTSDNLEADVRNNFGIQGEYDIPTVNGDENIDNAREAYYELIHRMGTDGTNFKAGAEFLESLTPEQKEQIFEYMSEIYEDGESRVPLEAMNKLLDEMKDPQAVIDGLSDETRGKLNVAYMGEEGNPFARNYGDGNITNNNDGIGFGELGLSEEQMNAMFDILYDVDRSDPQYARDTIIESADEFIEVLIALMTDYGKTENPEEYNYEKAADMLATLDIKQIQEVLDAVKDSKYGLQFGDMNLMMVFDQLLDNPKLKENFEAA
jgi:Spy/CpxP family protein refolding chaperone